MLGKILLVKILLMAIPNDLIALYGQVIYLEGFLPPRKDHVIKAAKVNCVPLDLFGILLAKATIAAKHDDAHQGFAGRKHSQYGDHRQQIHACPSGDPAGDKQGRGDGEKQDGPDDFIDPLGLKIPLRSLPGAAGKYSKKMKFLFAFQDDFLFLVLFLTLKEFRDGQ